MSYFTIGKLAQEAKVNVETVRYYERKGLMPEPVRNESGYRQYSRSDFQHLKFIKNAQKLGFSLKQIKELLSLQISPGYSCADVRERAQEKIRDIKSKIAELNKIKNALSELSGMCEINAPIEECRILEILNKT